MAKKGKKKSKKKDNSGAEAVGAVRTAVERTFQATADSAQSTRTRAQDLVDEVAGAASRVREMIEHIGVLEDLKASREVESSRAASPRSRAARSPRRASPRRVARARSPPRASPPRQAGRPEAGRRSQDRRRKTAARKPPRARPPRKPRGDDVPLDRIEAASSGPAPATRKPAAKKPSS